MAFRSRFPLIWPLEHRARRRGGGAEALASDCGDIKVDHRKMSALTDPIIVALSVWSRVLGSRARGNSAGGPAAPAGWQWHLSISGPAGFPDGHERREEVQEIAVRAVRTTSPRMYIYMGGEPTCPPSEDTRSLRTSRQLEPGHWAAGVFTRPTRLKIGRLDRELAAFANIIYRYPSVPSRF